MLATGVVGTVLLLACAIWAFRALAENPIQVPPLQASQPSDLPAPATKLDSTNFAAKLWNPPPQPIEPDALLVEKSQPSKPLNLQLIGIIEERAENGLAETIRRAAVYDADRDVLLILSNGDRIQEQTVKSITEQGIELSDGRSTRRLALIPPA